MAKGENSYKKKKTIADRFTETVFSWSLEDVFNENLFKDKVEKIPESFQSAKHYLGSYGNPLLEETRAELHSSLEMLYNAPFAQVISYKEAKPYGTKEYQVRVDHWRNKSSSGWGKEPYKTLPGDIFVLAHCKPETASDIQRAGNSWAFLSLIDIRGDGSTNFKVKASKEFGNNTKKNASLYIIFLANLIPHKRIWEALHMSSNLQIINETLGNKSAVKKKCDDCSKKNYGVGKEMVKNLSSKLNESQTGAVLSCLHMMKCKKKSAVELIWGPPGTGKTKTTSTLLVTLLRRNHKILVCAPTNVAITELASRVLKLVLDVQAVPSFCSLGDILLFGTKERLNIGSDIEEIYLDFRVQQLAECFGPLGWSHCFTNIIHVLANCVSEYETFLENESTKEGAESSDGQIKEKGCMSKSKVGRQKFKSFLEFVTERFVFTFSELKRCVSIICTHTTECYILKKNYKSMVSLIGLLDSFQSLLSQHDVVSEELQELFSHSEVVGDLSQSFGDNTSFFLFKKRNECLSSLKTLHGSLKELDMSSFKNEKTIKKFCFESASLIFCTVSSSFKLHNLKIKPTILVIDEAAQLKECESTIPLQLPGLRHAILVSDEWQLPATVKSKVSEEAGFGRSLFERLSSQNHKRHLLNVQYRMHPSISLFPNSEFYHNQIRDAAIVKSESHEKKYLPGSMFGPYSFINIIGGREERDEDGRSRKNVVEVAVIAKILQNLYKAWLNSQHELSIGIVSPYAAQVVAVQGKLGKKYDKISGFQVKVKTVDGFQGGEEDIIIMSTVRSSGCHSLDFVSKPQRTNVALTRARHCLWILGNERILANSQSVWSAIITDAKNRGCFYNADHDAHLANSITEVKKEFGQFDDFLNPDSILFKSSKWKVLFSDSFLKSLRKLTSIDKKSVINLLIKLSDGWRPRRHAMEFCESSLQINNFKVVGLHVVCTVDIVLTDSGHTQVLKIWDILPPENIPEFVKGLCSTFEKYSEAFINLCNEKCSEGKIEIPKIWPPSLEIVRFKDLSMNEIGSGSVGVVSDGRCYVESSSVSKSSSPRKFYSLSNCVVNHILSDRDARELDLPFEVPDQEKEIILFNRSTFVLGRSGTGKTTVLTMKLFQKEYLHCLTMEGLYGAKSNVVGLVNQNTVVEKKPEKTRGNVLRQLFVTTSPKLCNAVKQHLSYLSSRSFSCSGSQSSEDGPIHMDDNDAEETILKNIPDSLHGIPPSCYPLVITFEKFLVMLDGTLSNSYFERLINTTELPRSQMCTSRSHVRRSFVRTKEVNYERFCSQYWPRFNSHLTKQLDPSRVFTEIISLIKGGVQSMEASDGKLTREHYVVLSEECASGLISRKKRGRIYDLFMIYENMKMEKGEFDLADFVNDLHCRLKRERYQGDGMDFVYVDEVQELTMSQVALFRHVCSNVEEGFVFSGDTVQTIANFRIQDIRSLFDKKFAFEPKGKHKERKANGRMTNIFHLTQNFRSHAGILKLSQSIIELLYHFFPLSIDIMEPGTTTVIGESPLCLESWNNENAVFTLFGKSETKSRNVIGFGAQQVILVRDESARRKIKDCVGKQAVILTIMECKDLQFQDVLLYHFFGSSPLGKQWSVIYKYMKEQDLSIDMPSSCPHFDESKPEILLSELKQLYVAVASTKQRLWICDDTELSKPMFDYWKKKLLVQERVLDDQLAQAMQLSSSPEEWRSRGIELYFKHNYEMATICFEKAGDTFWEKKSKAAGLEAMADRMRSSNPEEANSALMEAAEIFTAIDKADSAARCFYNSGEHERAGRIDLEIFGDTELHRAGECFSLAGNYKLAANVYARGKFFPECVAACAKGKLFDLGLAHIERWKQQIKKESDVTRIGKEIEKTKQEFLERYACHYFELNDTKSMMKVVKDFNSMNLIRNFLKLLGCFDELMSLEEKSGNFLEAAEIAKLKGDELLAADLLGKAGNFKEAATLVLSYVLANSLWSSGKKGWPLKLFKRKDSLLTKAKLFAKNETKGFYEFVCTEADIMENKKSDLLTKQSQLNASQRHKSLRGEILSARKILDDHLASNFMKYFFKEHLVLDLVKHSEDMISQNQVSVESLAYFWKFWKEKVFGIFEYLARLETQDVCEFRSYGEFCLSFLGVRNKFHNQNLIYILLNPDADWTRNMEKESVGLGSDGKKGSIDVCQFVSAAQIYWSSEVLSVGFMVLHKLDALYNFVTKKSDIIFKKCRTLTLIYEVAECLLDSKFLKRTCQESEDLQKFIKLSTDDFCSHVFPLDWRKPLIEDLTFFKETDFCKNFLQQVIVEYTNPRDNLSPGKIGSIAMVILGSGKLNHELLKKILERMDWNPQWKAFFEILSRSRGLCFPSHSLISRFHEALVDAYNANDRTVFDCISPRCFLYLVDRLLIWASSLQGYFITTKASFVEWLIHQEIPINNTWSSSNAALDFQLSLPTVQFVISVIKKCLCDKGYLIEWIKRYTSRVNEYYSVIVCRMVVIICLLHANFRMALDLLFDLLGKSYIIEQLPWEFTDALKSHFLSLNLNVLAEAFKKFDNSLVIVSFGPNCSTYSFPSAIVFDMEVDRCKSDIMRRLFLKSCEASDSLSRAAAVRDGDSPREIVSTNSSTTGKSSDVLHSNFELGAGQDNRNQNKHESNLLMDYVSFWEIFEGLNSQESERDERKFTSNAQTIKVDVVKYIHILTAATNGSLQTKLGCEETSSREDVVSLVNELKQLSAALDGRNISLVKELSKKLQARRPRMEHILEQLFLQHETDQDTTTLKEVVASSDLCDKEDICVMSEKISDSDKFQSKVTQASIVLENKAEVAALKTKEGGSCHIL